MINRTGSLSYDLYIGDNNGVRSISGPDGTRTGIAIHQYDPRDSQGCLTLCSGTNTQPVTDLSDAIPDLDNDREPVLLIIEGRNVDGSTFSNSGNGTKYKGYSQSKKGAPSVSNEIDGSPNKDDITRD